MRKKRVIKHKRTPPIDYRQFIGFCVRYNNINYEVQEIDGVCGINKLLTFIPLKDLSSFVLTSEYNKTITLKTKDYLTWNEVKAGHRLPEHLRGAPPKVRTKTKVRKRKRKK